MTRRLMLLWFLLMPAMAWPHAGSKSWLTLQVDGTQVEGQLAASLVDIALALRLDIGATPAALGPQVLARGDEAAAYVSGGLVLLVNGQRQKLEILGIAAGSRGGETTIEFALRAQAAARIDSLDIGYTLFFEDDVLHEGLTRVEWDGGSASDAVFRLGEPLQHLQRGAASTRGFLQFLRSGVWHIWTGYDHVLFLLVLLLPAVLQVHARTWLPATRLPATLLRAATIVTAFTLAHSITLACAALGWIRLPERLVESAIALSVFIAAASNFVPVAAAIAGPWMAFGFGLLHGFGFAAVLGELVSARSDVWRPLLAFNLGVEIGQLAIVAVMLPLAWMMRSTRFYRWVVLRGGSAAVCACAMVWFVARVMPG